MRMEKDESKMMNRAQDPSYTGMKTYKAEEREQMPWMDDHLNLSEGHAGIKRFYYGAQGDRGEFNSHLNLERDIALKEADNFNQNLSNDIHNANTF